MKVGEIVRSIYEYSMNDTSIGIIVEENTEICGMILVENFTVYWSVGRITKEQDFEVKPINVLT